MFKTNCKVRLHVRVHTGAKPHSCRHCSQRFMWLVQLKRHRRHLLESHNEGTWLNCHICQKKFIHSRDFKTHILRHEGVKLYACSECPKRFYTSSILKHHQLVHSDCRTSEALAAVYVLEVSSVNNTFWDTLRDVLLASVLVTCNVCVSAKVMSSNSSESENKKIIALLYITLHYIT